MKVTSTLAIVAIVLGLTLVGSAQRQDSPEALLGAGLHQEELEDDCEEAIKIYDRVVRQQGASRNVAARAQLHIGFCRERLGQPDARTAYELASRYRDQPDVVAQAQARLAELDRQNASMSFGARLVVPGGAGYFSDRSITPDGRWLTMTDAEGIAIRDLRSGETKHLKVSTDSAVGSNVRLPQLSPDGRQVAYVGRGRELRLLPNDPGATARTLVPSASGVRSTIWLAWFPDSRSILVILSVSAEYLGQPPSQPGKWVIARISAADGKVEKVLHVLADSLSDFEGFDLSPDGRYVAYAARSRDDAPDRVIHVIAADGTGGSAEVVKTGLNKAPKWAPDGAHLLFLSDRSGSPSLWSIAVKGGKAVDLPHVLKKDVGDIEPIGVSRTGSYYYEEQQRTGSDGVNVFVADLDPGTGKLRGAAAYLTERFAGWNNSPSWSPDGKFVAFKRRRMANPNIFDLVVRTLQSGDERTFTAPDWINGFGPGVPAWLRDSSGLWVGQEPRPGRVERWLGHLDLRDGAFTKLVTVDKALGWLSAVSPDDKTAYLLYSRDGTYLTVDDRNSTRSSYGGIVAVDLTTGQRRDVFMFTGNGTVNSVALSRDGRTLAFLLYEEGQGRNATRLVSIQADGTNRQDLYVTSKSMANRPDQIQWAPNGRFLFFIEEGRVMRLSVEGGTPEFTGVAMARPDRTHPISLSPDGARIAFSDGAPWTTSREVWALDNLPTLLRSPREITGVAR